MVLVLLLCLLIVILFVYFDVKKPPNFPKGPPWLPIIGNYLYFRQRLAKLGFHHLIWQELCAEYQVPVVGLRLGRQLVVAAVGDEAVKEVHTKDAFDGRPDGFFFRHRTFNQRLGIVFADGDFWQKQRKFVVCHLRNFGLGRKEMENKIELEAQDLMNALQRRCGEPFDMQHLFDVSVLNVLWSMVAGYRFKQDDENLERLMRLIHNAFKSVDMAGGIVNQLPLLRHIAPDYTGIRKINEILNGLYGFIQKTVDEHKDRNCQEAQDLIDAFLIHQKIDGSFSDQQLLSLILDLFMAGSETTSNTLSFAAMYMTEYPKIQKKVQTELNDVVGENRLPTLQDRPNLPYTEAVLMEVQRLTNVPPLGIAHRAVRNTTLLGYNIPQGTLVLPSLYSIHIKNTFWQSPEEFIPERFLDEDGRRKSIPEVHFAPFGSGKRRCLGESLARANLYLFFATILHSFELRKDPDGPELNLKGHDGITISPGPFKVLLVARNQ